MSKRQKLIDRLLKLPNDFTFDEMVVLLAYFGYELNQKTSGSSVKFIKNHSNEVIQFHKPHPNKVLKRYILRQIIEKLRKENQL